MRHPAVVCYRTTDELVELKNWFYNFDGQIDNRSRAILRVKAYCSRGKVPHGLEATSLLSSVCLSDPSLPSNHPKQEDSNCLQLSYSMALIRFVNGLLDPFQQSSYAIPLHQLARNLNLPGFFVELRHMGTHEQLPTLEILRIGARRALNWLYDNYWCWIDKMENSAEDEESETATIDAAIDDLKVFKKIRKQNLDVIYKFGNTTEIGQKYWNSIKGLKQIDPALLIEVLLFKNFLIYNHDKLAMRPKFKFNSLIFKLYLPLLDELGSNFKLQLLKKIFLVLSEPTSIEHPYETVQFLKWTRLLIRNLVTNLPSKYTMLHTQKSHFVSAESDVILIIAHETSRLTKEDREKCLSELVELSKGILDSSKLESLEADLAEVKKEIRLESFAAPPLVEDLFAEDSGATKRDCESWESDIKSLKRQKFNSHTSERPTKVYFLEDYPQWKPTPFGTLL
ncbi:uncharacterized protein PRCAT00004091001 [Priceomyces carsonii]|uniref:uncharacterized protein n=1 Tax=Priceomyces carsonii TaxID=28549 RepID=UPI002EDA682A|nr:unnamed protein product [Priceomyces carsonii]